MGIGRKRVPGVFRFVLILTLFLISAVNQYFSKCPIDPVPIDLPPLPSLEWNDALDQAEHLHEGTLLGPESMAISSDGLFMYMGLADGQIVRMTKDGRIETVIRTGSFHKDCGKGGPEDTTFTHFVCGRPLGLLFVNGSSIPKAAYGGDLLLVADAYKGLLAIDVDSAKPSVTTLAFQAVGDSKPFQLANSIAQGPDGKIYLTETCSSFRLREILYCGFQGSLEGRVMVYDPREDTTTVIIDGLYMTNGITLTTDSKALLVVSGVQVLRYDLVKKELDQEPFIMALPCIGDNIRRTELFGGGYVIGGASKYGQPFSLLKMLADKPFLRKLLVTFLPYAWLTHLIPKHSMVVFVSDTGMRTFQDRAGRTPWISEAAVFGDWLYLGSWYNPFLARVPISSLEMLIPQKTEL